MARTCWVTDMVAWSSFEGITQQHASLTGRTSAFQGGGDRKQHSCLNKTRYHPVEHHWHRHWRTDSEIEFHVIVTQVQAAVPNLFRTCLEIFQNVWCHCPTVQTIQKPNNDFEDHFTLGNWLNRHWSTWLVCLNVPHTNPTRPIKHIWGKMLHLLSHYTKSAPPVGDITHPVNILWRSTPMSHWIQSLEYLALTIFHPLFLSFHQRHYRYPHSQTSDPDNPLTESFLGDYQSLQCLGWERFLAGCDATCWFSTSSGKTRPQSHLGSLRPRREALCVWDAAIFSQQNSSSPHHICSPGPANPAEVKRRSGASCALRRFKASCWNSAEQMAAV